MANSSSGLSPATRAKELFDRRVGWLSVWDTAYEFICPERAVIYRTRRTGSEIQDQVYDSTAIEAAERLAGILSNGLIPPWQKWFRLLPDDRLPEAQRAELVAPLEIARDMVLARVAASGLYDHMQAMLLDRIVGGTGAFRVVPWRGVTKVVTVPLAYLAISENAAGEVSEVAAKQDMTAFDIFNQWPGAASELQRRVPKGAERKTTFTVYEYDAQQADGTWKHCTAVGGGGGSVEAGGIGGSGPSEGVGDITLDEYTTPMPRFLVTRWATLPGTPYGRGPGLRALSDVRCLNKLKELVLKNAAKAVSGVYTGVDDGVMNPYTLVFRPGTVIPVASNSPNEPSLRPLENASQFDVAAFSMDKLAADIKATFMVDQFGALDVTPRSATEIAERTKTLATLLGGTLIRLQNEIVLPLVRMFLVEIAPELAEQGLDLAQIAPNTEIVSQLALNQWVTDSNSILEFAQITTQFGQVDPRAGFLLDVPQALRKVAELRGIDAALLRTPDEVDELNQAVSEQQAARAQQAGQVLSPGAVQ